MLNKQCQRDLNKIINHLRLCGVSINATRRSFESAGDMGVALMLRNEAMERWDISGMVADYIVKEGGTVNYAETPAPIKPSTTIDHLQEVLKLDHASVITLDTMITEAMQRESFKTALFMRDIRNYCKKEYDELESRIKELGAFFNDPSGFVSYNNFLCEEYGDHYHYSYERNC